MPKNDKLTEAARRGSGLPERNEAMADNKIEDRALDLILSDEVIASDLRRRASERLGRDIGAPPNEDDAEAYDALTTETTKLLKRVKELNKSTLHRAVPGDGA